jgi:NtrC-family two-component system sensor histidine kinase KinB
VTADRNEMPPMPAKIANTADPSPEAPSRPRSPFGLRPKLALGFGGLLLLLVATGWQSISLLDRLGGSIDVILKENYRSVLACQDMKEALERMDSGALFALADDPARGRQLAAEHQPRFEEALAIERGNVTLAGEGPLAERLADLYGSYREALPRVFDEARPVAQRRAVYFETLLPLFQQIKATATGILQLNQANMVEANARARDLAAEARRRMVLLLAAGALVAAGFVVFLSRAILTPLGQLTRSVREVERGNLDLTVPVGSGDELGQLAAAFNAMASRLRALRRSDQARLLRAQRTSQQAIDSLPDAVAVFSPEGEVELANQAAQSLLGLKAGEPVPARHADWLLPLLGHDRRLGRGERGPDRGFEAAVQLFHDGKERFYLPHAVAVWEADDAPPSRETDLRLAGTTLILSDVTDLRRLDEIKSGLVSTVSHELRTPLTSVQMALHVLLAEQVGSLTPEQTELLVAARDDAERLREIIVNLLEISRLEQRSQQLHLEPTAPRDFVEDAAAGLRSAAADQEVELAVEIDPAAANVLIDRTRARLVLTNLLDNALHHTGAGGRITVTAAPSEPSQAARRVRFRVADSGRGIPAEALPRVFERFYQVPGTEDAGGAGLGLSIAKEIVQAHGGEIGVHSEPGSGATFWFDLPTTREAATPPATSGRPDATESGAISLL